MTTTPTREEEIAWAAGLFEGEGCTTKSGGVLVARLNSTDEETPDALEAVRLLMPWLGRRRLLGLEPSREKRECGWGCTAQTRTLIRHVQRGHVFTCFGLAGL
jgi:hypothetical protein